MTTLTHIPTPLPLLLRRMQHQVLPIVAVIVCGSLAGWIWTTQNRSAVASGEVEAVKVELQSKFAGVLVELPRPVKLFESVRAGQVVARVDTTFAQSELRRLEQEFSQLKENSAATMPTASTAAWYQERIDQLREQISQADIKSPIDGTVTAILRRAGEGAELGKPIIVIAADRGECIVGYLREDYLVRPAQGMAVQIRTRSKPNHRYRSHVQTIGAQVEPLPYRYWRNPAVMEWGWPVQIALPEKAQLTPGEMVDLVMKSKDGD